MFEVFLSNRAEKTLKLLNSKMKEQIKEAIDKFIHTHSPRDYDVKKLKGIKSTYRLRIGNYRIIYQVDFNRKLIFVLSIISREKAYKRL